MNIVTSDDIQPLKTIIELLGVPLEEEVLDEPSHDFKPPAQATNTGVPPAVTVNLVENEMPDLINDYESLEGDMESLEVVETIIDSGANRSMFLNSSYFTDLKKLEVPIQIAGKNYLLIRHWFCWHTKKLSFCA